MLTIDPAGFSARRLAFMETLQAVLPHREDLTLGMLAEALRVHSAGSLYSQQAWAEHCLERVLRGEPLPWEPAPSGLTPPLA
jgi:hypothetical protein